jgi:hypothetical protein
VKVGKPAGVQVQRWFVSLVVLLLCSQLLALAGSIALARSAKDALSGGDPDPLMAAAFHSDVLAAQRDLFQYLAYGSETPAAALSQLEQVQKGLESLRRSGLQRGSETEFATMEESAREYRKLLDRWLQSGQRTGAGETSPADGANALEIGRALEERARRLSEAVQAEVRQKNLWSLRLASGALWTTFGLIAGSALSVAALVRWWRRFQEVALGV